MTKDITLMMIKQSLSVIISGKERFDGYSNPIPLYNIPAKNGFCVELPDIAQLLLLVQKHPR